MRRRSLARLAVVSTFAALFTAAVPSARAAAIYTTTNLGRDIGRVYAFADDGSYLAAAPDTGRTYLGRGGATLATDGLGLDTSSAGGPLYQAQLTAGGRLLAANGDALTPDRVREPDGSVHLIQGLGPNEHVLGINDKHQVLVETRGFPLDWRVTVKSADDQWRLDPSRGRVVVALDRPAWTGQESVSAFGPNGEVGLSRIYYIPPSGRGNYTSLFISADNQQTMTPKGGYEGQPEFINRNGQYSIRWSALKFLNDQGDSVGVDGVSQLYRYYNSDGSDFLLDKLLPVPGSKIFNAAMNLRGDLLISADVPGLGRTTYELTLGNSAQPVPEPATWATAAVLVTVGGLWTRRTRQA